ncbi:MAG: AAA-like domain-containing protein [Methylococcales bacterium]|nr:AAA-like domain-containing protein [Methylococcales bacterium]
MSNYHVGGTLPPDSPSYVYRPADDELYQGLKSGEFCYILNSRQMGKSSLRIKTMQRMQAEGIICLGVDITEIGSVNITDEEWYAGLVDTLVNGLEATNLFLQHGNFDLNDWWETHHLLSPLQRFGKFIETLLLPLNQPLIIFIDEIDSILPLPFKEDFFALIRACFNNRQEKAAYKRITFAIFGVATPSDLIGDKGRTPFNIGKAVELTGFELPAAFALGKDFDANDVITHALLTEILIWTGGQPFLTQKVCKLVADSKLTTGHDLQKLIQKNIIENWESQDIPQHFKTISDRIKANERVSAELLGIYQQIVMQGQIKADDSYPQMILRLTGIVVKQQAQLKIYNRLYADIFNLEWVETELAALRPYSQALMIWESTDRNDNSRLLVGQALDDALAWAQNKNLTPSDYQFLDTCREAVIQEQKKQTQRFKVFSTISSLLFITALLSTGFGFMQWQQAKKSTQKGLRTQSLFLADLAVQQIQKGDEVTAMLLALEALPKNKDNNERPYVHQAYSALYNAMVRKKERLHWHYDEIITAAAYAPNSPILAIALANGWIYLVDKESGNLLNRFEAHKNSISSLRFNPTGDRILTSSDDNSAKMWDLAGQKLSIFEGHQAVVISAIFNPMGDKVLTASDDNTAKLWDLTGQEIANFKGHYGWVKSAVFNPAGDRVLTASSDGTAKSWDLTGQLLVTFSGHQGTVSNALFNHAGDRILTASWDKTAILWNLNGEQLTHFKGHKNKVRKAIFSPFDDKILTASDDKTAKLWTPKGQELASFIGHHGRIIDITFNPQGTKVLTASNDSIAKLWDLTGHELNSFKSHQDVISSAMFNPQGNKIFTTSIDNTAKLWDLSNPQLISFNDHNHTVFDAVFSPLSDKILTASADYSAKLWNLSGQQLVSFEGHQYDVVSAVFNKAGDRVLTASKDKTAKLWDLNGHELTQFKGHQGWLRKAIFNTIGDRVLTISDDNTAKLWTIEGDNMVTFKGHQGAIIDANFNHTGDRIVTTSSDNTAKLWDLTGRELATFKGHSAPVVSAEFNSTDDRVLTASDDTTAKIWALSGQELVSFEGHQDWVFTAVFNPDSDLVLTASKDKTIKLWNLSGQELANFKGHQGGVRSALFNHKGDKILSASADNSAKLWNLQGQELVSLEGHKRPIFSAVFNRSDDKILTASEDTTVKLWTYPATPQALINSAKKIVPRQLTETQKRQFFLDTENR